MKTYTISITFTDQQAKNPIEAVENFIEYLKEDANMYIYDVEDEESGERFSVDMSEDDENKVLPNND